jgi:hypothetical protein
MGETVDGKQTVGCFVFLSAKRSPGKRLSSNDRFVMPSSMPRNRRRSLDIKALRRVDFSFIRSSEKDSKYNEHNDFLAIRYGLGLKVNVQPIIAHSIDPSHSVPMSPRPHTG